MWNFVSKKTPQRWCGTLSIIADAVLAYVFGRRKDEALVKLQTLLKSFGTTRYYTDQLHGIVIGWFVNRYGFDCLGKTTNSTSATRSE